MGRDGGNAEVGPVTTGSGGTTPHPASNSKTSAAKKRAIGIIEPPNVEHPICLHLRQTLQHLVGRRHSLAVHVIGALGGDHVHQFLGHVDV